MDSDEIAVAPATVLSPRMNFLDTAILDFNPWQGITPMDTKATKATNPPPPIEPPAKKLRPTNEHVHFTQPSSNHEDLRNDLEDFGFTTQQIKDMMARKEQPWNPGAPSHLLMEEKTAQVSREKRERVKKNGGSGTEKKYEPLFLTEGSNWALFDPHQGYPAHLASPPSFFEQFETFKPGNSRILEYNVHTHSIRVKSTPPFLLEGKRIEYTRLGPKVIEVPVKRGPGRPRKHPLPANGIANVASKIDRPSAVVGTKTGRPRGRPRKTPVPVEESESELSDVEIDDAEYGDEIKVKQEGNADEG